MLRAERTEKPLDELTDEEVHAEVLQRLGYGTNDARARRERRRFLRVLRDRGIDLGE